jgi:hypothetical protein
MLQASRRAVMAGLAALGSVFLARRANADCNPTDCTAGDCMCVGFCYTRQTGECFTTCIWYCFSGTCRAVDGGEPDNCIYTCCTKSVVCCVQSCGQLCPGVDG